MLTQIRFRWEFHVLTYDVNSAYLNPYETGNYKFISVVTRVRCLPESVRRIETVALRYARLRYAVTRGIATGRSLLFIYILVRVVRKLKLM